MIAVNWWQIVATCLAGWGLGWRTLGRLAREFMRPPWVVSLDGNGYYTFTSNGSATGVRVAIKRKWRDKDYTKNFIVIGTLKLGEEDFDEKFLDLRDTARERARQLNRLEGTLA